MNKVLEYIKKLPYWYVLAIPVLVLFAGIASNQAVLIANHDKFPVMVNSKKVQAITQGMSEEQRIKVLNLIEVKTSIVKKTEVEKADPDGMIDYIHCVMSPSSHLKALADIFDMQQYIMSVGDAFIELGAYMLNFAPIVWLTLIIRKLLAN